MTGVWCPVGTHTRLISSGHCLYHSFVFPRHYHTMPSLLRFVPTTLYTPRCRLPKFSVISVARVPSPAPRCTDLCEFVRFDHYLNFSYELGVTLNLQPVLETSLASPSAVGISYRLCAHHLSGGERGVDGRTTQRHRLSNRTMGLGRVGCRVGRVSTQ